MDCNLACPARRSCFLFIIFYVAVTVWWLLQFGWNKIRSSAACAEYARSSRRQSKRVRSTASPGDAIASRAQGHTRTHGLNVCLFRWFRTHTHTAQVCCARVRFYSQTTQRACVERRSMETGLVDARKRLISPCAKYTRLVRWICLSPPPCLSPVACECVYVELLRCRLRTQVSTSERLMYIQWRTQKCYT